METRKHKVQEKKMGRKNMGLKACVKKINVFISADVFQERVTSPFRLRAPIISKEMQHVLYD